MSSLLQHRGAISDGKVELLMYLETYTQTPLACSHCGHVWSDGDVHCQGCGRFVLFAWDHETRDSYGSSSKSATDRLTMEDAIKHPAYAECCRHDSGRVETTSVGNRWEVRDTETVELTRPNGSTAHCAKLYRIWRKPVGMWGCWVVFRYNGKEHVPDLSVPIGVTKLPRGAEPLTDEEAAAYWFSE